MCQRSFSVVVETSRCFLFCVSRTYLWREKSKMSPLFFIFVRFHPLCGCMYPFFANILSFCCFGSFICRNFFLAVKCMSVTEHREGLGVLCMEKIAKKTK